MVTRLLPALVLAFAVLAASCGGGRETKLSAPVEPVDGTVVVNAFDFHFEPNNIVLHKDEQVRIALTNGGGALHNLKVDGIAIEVTDAQSSGPLKGDEGELFVGADAGDQGSITFVPQETGEFEFYCSIPEHRSLGMKGRLAVRAPVPG